MATFFEYGKNNLIQINISNNGPLFDAMLKNTALEPTYDKSSEKSLMLTHNLFKINNIVSWS